MKAQIHPQWFEDAQVVCACGNIFTTGSTRQKIEVDICYNCHPFYTGQMKNIDTAGRIDAWKNKMEGAQAKVLSKSDKRKVKKQQKLEREFERPDSLAELRTTKKN
jgi:large subunit ribosomal protein L31